MRVPEKMKEIFANLFHKNTRSKHAGVVLNQPIESEKNDWIGVSSYVDNLASAIDGGARMVAVTSDFGSGKSSLISLYKKQHETKITEVHIRPKYVYTINMWETIDGAPDQDKMSVADLHKTFLFHVINQLSPTKGSYISKRLSRNYGLFSLESSSIVKNMLLVLLLVAIVIGEGVRRFGEELGSVLFLEQQHLQVIMFAAYVTALVCGLLVLFRSDFIFSSAKSEGNREIDENVLIDYYNHEVLYRKFWRHYIFVIEDLDRIDDMNLVKGFLKEIRKYYLTDRNRRSLFHNNRVTFVINIKPESLLKNAAVRGDVPQKTERSADQEARSAERLYSKFFDYILNLRKINIDNYDSILLGLLMEIQDELHKVKLLKDGEEVLIENIPGMQWIIRGEELGIREIKNRLNAALALYQNLITKFANSSITFEKCAIATYLITEYEDDFYKLKDRDIETIIEKYISGVLEEDSKTWGDNWKDLSGRFKRELYDLVDNKKVDSNYRIYFYNYPQGSKLYDLSGTIIYNSIIYNESPKNTEEYEKHLVNVKDEVIEDAYGKVMQLNIIFPRFIVEYEKLFSIAANEFRQKLMEVIARLPFDSSNISRTEKWIGIIVSYREKIEYRDKLLEDISILLNEKAKDKEILNVLRKKICKTIPEDVLFFQRLFREENSFITPEEIRAINKIEVIIRLINYDQMYNSLEECVEIHHLIMEHLQKLEDYILFYRKMIETFKMEEVLGMVKEYCMGIDQVPESLRAGLEEKVSKGNLKMKEYVELLCSVTEMEDKALDSIIEIGWVWGLPLRICERIASRGKYFNYVCNMAREHMQELDLGSSYVHGAILENAVWIYKNMPEVWSEIRRCVLKQGALIPDYLVLFGPDFPRIEKEELDLVEDYGNAILIFQENEITEDETDLVADYFNKKYRNQTESFEILQYLSELEKEVAESLFFKLDMKNITYRIMSASRRNTIDSKLIELFGLEEDDGLKIDFMNHIGMSIDRLEKDLYLALNQDADLLKKYLDYVNSLEKIEPATMQNIVNLGSIYIYSDRINEKLFEMKYYTRYVSSKTADMGRFEIEEDRRKVLWRTYKSMFNGSNFGRTQLYMKKNQEFLRQLIDEAAYVDSGEQLMNYSAARQRKELMEYVVRTMDKEELCEYFSKINGFESREAAKSFVEIVLKNSALLKDESVYTNTHEKLNDPGLKAKYTKARKKLLKDSDSH